MKLRIIKQSNQVLLLCNNGSISKVDGEILSRLLRDFKKPNSFKGDLGYWTETYPNMEDVYGETLAFVDDALRLVILSEKLFSSKEKVIEKKVVYISATEYAEKHGKSRPSVKNMCAAGRIPGAYKTSSGWLIPEDAPYPERKPRNG